MPNIINVFVSCALEDQQMWKELEKHLVSFKRKGFINLWTTAGSLREDDRYEITLYHLNNAHLILLLISPDYIASDYLYEIEMKRALERLDTEEVWVLPILLHPVCWEDEPFSKLQMVPDRNNYPIPISQWRKKRLAYLLISYRIRDIVYHLLNLSDAKVVSALISERIKTPYVPLLAGKAYTLDLNIKELENLSDLIESGIQVPTTDIPQQGLDTEWTVYSQTVELQASLLNDDTSVSTTESGLWAAQFSLHIPHEGTGPSKQLQVIPKTIKNPHLNVLVYARGELYRDFLIELTVSNIDAAFNTQGTPVSEVKADAVYAPADQLDLAMPYNWQRPPSKLSLYVIDEEHISVKGSHVMVTEGVMDWCGVREAVGELIKKVRLCADKFREEQSTYLDQIDTEDLESRLERFHPHVNWLTSNEADRQHQQVWDEQIKNSEELYQLAGYGYALYKQFFPDGSPLRTILDELKISSSLFIHWTHKPHGSWIPSIPWGLLYAKKPEPKQPIDPLNFFGLRFRIEYIPYAPVGGHVRNRRRDLGLPGSIYRGNCLYWESEHNDPTTNEAKWQHRLWSDWTSQIFVPKSYEELDTSPKIALTQLLSSSLLHRPMPILYFYCKCGLEEEAKLPILYLANSDTVTYLDLDQCECMDNPLIFMNACTTSASDPYSVNQLQELFFSKGCRAYLGTEAKVPIHLGSCFAAIFFHFFYRKCRDWPEPISAGEAMIQTRLFLWSQYKNIGGLLYTYINQSQLFMADATELEKLDL